MFCLRKGAEDFSRIDKSALYRVNGMKRRKCTESGVLRAVHNLSLALKSY